MTNASRFLLPLACRAVDTAHTDYAQESAARALFAIDDVDQGPDALDDQAERREYPIPVSL